MVSEVVMSVLSDNTNRRITVQQAATATAKVEEKAKKEPVKRARKPSVPKKKDGADALVGQPCPVCGKGTIIKGKTAYGCSEWRNGCTYRKGFE